MAEDKIGTMLPCNVIVQEKVTGAAQYTDDIAFGNALHHCRVKRSPRTPDQAHRPDMTSNTASR